MDYLQKQTSQNNTEGDRFLQKIISWTPESRSSHLKCSVKKVLLKIYEISQTSTYRGVSF